ncbi:MAG: dihydrolipoyl dehydrogenase [Candidatus Hecatellaceae archaeon]
MEGLQDRKTQYTFSKLKGLKAEALEKVNVYLAVLGGGPGGYSAAIMAAQLGIKVALIEKDKLGGTCLNRGCIPTKFLISAVNLLRSRSKLGYYGLSGSLKLDLKSLIDGKNRMVSRLRTGLENLLRSWDIKIIHGVGRLRSPRRIEVTAGDEGGYEVEASKVILAPGSRCPDKGEIASEVEGVLNTDEALELEEPPESLLVVGGGPSGIELAYVYAWLGSRVTLAEAMSQILPGEDMETADMLKFSLEKTGIKVLTGRKLKGVTRGNGTVKAFFETGEGDEAFEAEKVLLAIGRKANIENLGLKDVDVKTKRGRILVNEFMETSAKGVYAVGDAAGGLYAHTAFIEGEAAARNAFGGRVKVNFEAIPRCLYGSPEVAGVGLTEKQAKAQGYRVKIGRFPYMANGRAATLLETEGMVKIVADAKTGIILGVQIIGFEATELIAEATLALKLKCTVEDLASTVHAHPTLSEALREAALDAMDRALHKPYRQRENQG